MKKSYAATFFQHFRPQKPNLVPRTYTLPFGLGPKLKSRGRGPGNEVAFQEPLLQFGLKRKVAVLLSVSRIFNLSLPHISNTVKRHYNLLLTSNRCKTLCQHPPVVAYRCSLNLSFRCAENCANWPYISDGLNNYTFFLPAIHVPLTLISLMK